MGTTFAARYPGTCGSCRYPIIPGDPIRPDEDAGGFVHAGCDNAAPGFVEPHPPRPVCPRCFTELPVSGVCGVCE